MIFKRFELDRLSSSYIDIDEAFTVNPEFVENHPRLNELRDVFIVGQNYYDPHSAQLVLDLKIEGTMVVPCSISLKEVEIDFSIPFNETFSFDDLAHEDSGLEVNGDVLDLDPFIYESITAEIPLRIIHPDLESYPQGEGWEVLTEEDFIKQKSQEIDPRLAKLKDFKF